MEFDLTTKEARKKYTDMLLNLTATGYANTNNLVSKEFKNLINEFIEGEIAYDEFYIKGKKLIHEI